MGFRKRLYALHVHSRERDSQTNCCTLQLDLQQDALAEVGWWVRCRSKDPISSAGLLIDQMNTSLVVNLDYDLAWLGDSHLLERLLLLRRLYERICRGVVLEEAAF